MSDISELKAAFKSVLGGHYLPDRQAEIKAIIGGKDLPDGYAEAKKGMMKLQPIDAKFGRK